MEMEDQAKTWGFICRFAKQADQRTQGRHNLVAMQPFRLGRCRMRWAVSLQLFQDARSAVILQMEPPTTRQCVQRPGAEGMVFHRSWDRWVADFKWWMLPLAKGPGEYMFDLLKQSVGPLVHTFRSLQRV